MFCLNTLDFGISSTSSTYGELNKKSIKTLLFYQFPYLVPLIKDNKETQGTGCVKHFPTIIDIFAHLTLQQLIDEV